MHVNVYIKVVLLDNDNKRCDLDKMLKVGYQKKHSESKKC